MVWPACLNNRILWLIASLTSLAVIAAMLGPLPLPASARDLLGRELSNILHRNLTMEQVHIDPGRMAASIDHIVMAEPEGQPILQIDRLDINLALWLTLSQRTVILDELTLHAPSLEITGIGQPDSNLSRLFSDLQTNTPSGDNTTSLVIQFLHIDQGSLHVRDRGTDATPLISLDHLQLDLEDFATGRQTKTLYRLITGIQGQQGQLAWQGQIGIQPFTSSGTLDIQDLELSSLLPVISPWVDLDAMEGKLNFAGHYQYQAANDTESACWSLTDGKILLENSRVKPRHIPTPLTEIGRFQLDGITMDSAQHHLSVQEAQVADAHVTMRRSLQGAWNWATILKSRSMEHTHTAPVTSPTPVWQASTEKLLVNRLALLYEDQTDNSRISLASADMTASLDASFSSTGSDMNARLEHARLDDIHLASAVPESAPWLELSRTELGPASLSLKNRRASLEKIVIQGGQLRSDMLPDAQADSTPITRESSPAPWQFRLKTLQMSDMAAHYFLGDRSNPVSLDFTSIEGNASMLGWPMQDQTSFTLRSSLNQESLLNIDGQWNPVERHGKATINVGQLKLAMLQPLLDQQAAISIQDGLASAMLEVSMEDRTGKPALVMSGHGRMDQLKLSDTTDNSPLLSAEVLQVNDIEWQPETNRLFIREIRASEPKAVFSVDAHGASNISRLWREKTHNTPPDTGQAGSGYRFGLGRMVLDKGTLDYSDLSLILPYTTRITDLGGTLTGISNLSGTQAKLNLAGRVLPYGEASIQGSLMPSAMHQETDLSIHLANVDMPALSPYSATFAGRRIDAGKLNLDVLYQITRGNLHSVNSIHLQKFRLGHRVREADATSLPLDLAVSLLTDASGAIRLSIPVEGKVGDPSFSYGAFFRTALFNMLSQVITTPFHLLDTLLAGEHELGNGEIFFAPGKAYLAPPEREKLASIAEHLAQKPDLLIRIHGGVDATQDIHALQLQMTARAIMAAFDMTIAPENDPDPVNTHDARTQRTLETMAEQAGILDKTLASYTQASGHPPDRVGIMAGWFSKSSTTPDFYESLLAAIAGKQVIKPSALDDLATKRASSIQEAMTHNRSPGLASRIQVTGNQTARYDENQGIVLSLELDYKN